MIVKYVRERGYVGEGKDPHLTLGNEYIVLTLDYHMTDGFQFSLLSDSEDDPGVWKAAFFDIVDTRVPEDFIFEFSDGTNYPFRLGRIAIGNDIKLTSISRTIFIR